MPNASLDSLEARQALVDQILLNRPLIHYMSGEDMQAGAPSGVWATDEDCYRFLAEHCHRGSRTLETGCGLSTILFVAWGSHHRCVTPLREEADAVIDHCRNHGIPTDHLQFMIAPSSEALPRLGDSDGPLDIVLIDGSHGFPAPMIDWYYSAARLRRDGIVVIDDLQLPAVRILTDYLDSDPRWLRVRSTEKWAAYKRQNEGPLVEDWYLQPFYGLPGLRMSLARSVRRRVRRVFRRRGSR